MGIVLWGVISTRYNMVHFIHNRRRSTRMRWLGGFLTYLYLAAMELGRETEGRASYCNPCYRRDGLAFTDALECDLNSKPGSEDLSKTFA
jgi:hypothetical protein